MKRNRSSLSAASIAIVRAIESEKPAGKRLVYDPFARRFISSGLFHFVNFFYRLGLGERKGPGVWEFLITRERYIDDYLQDRLNDGLAQLVILGAGFDARAYRFEALKHKAIRVFEVDHPATQAAKLQKLAQIFGKSPSHVVYVGIDFNQQKLGSQLAESGYDERLKTLFIWQGVTEYLTPEAVDETLRFIHDHSAPGSSVIFDYVDTAILKGAPRHGEVSSMRRYRHVSGEELVFGIPIAEVTAFLEARGFTEIVSADHRDLAQLYLGGSRKVADGYAIASAVVPEAGT